MSLRAKIILTGVNIAFLIVALLSPDNTTPLASLITIVSSVSWTLSSNIEQPIPSFIMSFYVGIATLFSILCIVLGFSGTIYYTETAGSYMYKFYDNVAILGGFQFDYVYFAVIIAAVVILLMTAELHAASIKERLNQKLLKIME